MQIRFLYIAILFSLSCYAQDSTKSTFFDFAETNINVGMSGFIYENDAFFADEGDKASPGLSYGFELKVGKQLNKRLNFKLGLAYQIFCDNYSKEALIFPDDTAHGFNLHNKHALVSIPLALQFSPIQELPLEIGIGITASYFFKSTREVTVSHEINKPEVSTEIDNISYQEIAGTASVFYFLPIKNKLEGIIGIQAYRSIYGLEEWKYGNFIGDYVNLSSSIGIRYSF